MKYKSKKNLAVHETSHEASSAHEAEGGNPWMMKHGNLAQEQARGLPT